MSTPEHPVQLVESELKRQQELKMTEDLQLKVDRSLLNKSFDVYKLKHKSLFASVDDSKAPKPIISIELKQSLQQRTIQPRSFANKSLKLDKISDIARTNQCFTINDTFYFYDSQSVFVYDSSQKSVETVFSIQPNGDTDSTLQISSVVGCANHIIASFDTGLTIFDCESKTQNTIALNDILPYDNCKVESAIVTPNEIYCILSHWNTDEIPHVITALMLTRNKTLEPKLLWTKQSDGKLRYSFFDDSNNAWVLSMGKFVPLSSENDSSGAANNPPPAKKRKLNDNSVANEEANESKSEIDTFEFRNKITSGGDPMCVLECFNSDSGKSMTCFDFKDSKSCRDLLGFSRGNNDALFWIGVKFNVDMVCFGLMKDDSNQWSLKHKQTYPGMAMIAEGRKDKKEIILNAKADVATVVDFTEFLSLFRLPAPKAYSADQEFIRFADKKPIVATALMGNELYVVKPDSLFIYQLN